VPALVGFRHRDAKLAGSFSNLATELPEVGVLANPLGNDVGRSTQCIFGGFDILLGIDKRTGRRVEFVLRGLTIPDGVCERFESPFAGLSRTGLAFGAVREIKIFEPLEGVCLMNCFLQFIGQFPLRGDQPQDGIRTLGNLSTLEGRFLDCSNLLLVEPSSAFFPIAGDKRNRIPLIQQSKRLFDLVEVESQISREGSQVNLGLMRHKRRTSKG